MYADPDPAAQINADPDTDTDPDPKPWLNGGASTFYQGGAQVRFPDDVIQYLAFGEKYWDVMYTLRPSTSSQPSSTGT